MRSSTRRNSRRGKGDVFASAGCFSDREANSNRMPSAVVNEFDVEASATSAELRFLEQKKEEITQLWIVCSI